MILYKICREEKFNASKEFCENYEESIIRLINRNCMKHLLFLPSKINSFPNLIICNTTRCNSVSFLFWSLFYLQILALGTWRHWTLHRNRKWGNNSYQENWSLWNILSTTISIITFEPTVFHLDCFIYAIEVTKVLSRAFFQF